METQVYRRDLWPQWKERLGQKEKVTLTYALPHVKEITGEILHREPGLMLREDLEGREGGWGGRSRSGYTYNTADFYKAIFLQLKK